MSRYITFKEAVDYTAARLKEGANLTDIRRELMALSEEYWDMITFSDVWKTAKRKNQESE